MLIWVGSSLWAWGDWKCGLVELDLLINECMMYIFLDWRHDRSASQQVKQNSSSSRLHYITGLARRWWCRPQLAQLCSTQSYHARSNNFIMLKYQMSPPSRNQCLHFEQITAYPFILVYPELMVTGMTQLITGLWWSCSKDTQWVDI